MGTYSIPKVLLLFNWYPVYLSSVVLFGFLFNKTALSLYVKVVNIHLL